MFKINWNSHWERLSVERDRRSGTIFLFRKADNWNEAAMAPLFIVEQDTIGM